jgi:hypothetical protein
VSAHGRRFAFESLAENLSPFNDDDFTTVYVRGAL